MTQDEILKLRKRFSHLTRQGRYKQIKHAQKLCWDCDQPIGEGLKFRCREHEDGLKIIRRRYNEKQRGKGAKPAGSD